MRLPRRPLTQAALPQEQYLEFSTTVPASSALYGLGERTSSTGIELRRDGIPLALWNRDSPAAAPDQNVYGSHPILLEIREGAPPAPGQTLACSCSWPRPCGRPQRGPPAPRLITVARGCSRPRPCVRPRPGVAVPRLIRGDGARADGTAHGIALLNSNGMDVTLTQTRVTWHVTGGVIDLYFLMGPTPMDVLDQLTQIIGRPMMPPFWSLGLMNSKCAPLGCTRRPCCSRAVCMPCGRASGPPARLVRPCVALRRSCG